MEKGLVLQREYMLLGIMMLVTVVLGMVPPLEVAGMMMLFYFVPALIAAYVTSIGVFLGAGIIVLMVSIPVLDSPSDKYFPVAIVSYLICAGVVVIRRSLKIDETLLVATGLLLLMGYPLLTVIYYYLVDLELLHATLLSSRYVVQSLFCILVAEAVVLAATLSDWRWLGPVRTGLGFRPSLVQVAELITSVAVTISLVISLIMFWRSWEAEIDDEIQRAAFSRLEDRHTTAAGIVRERLQLSLRHAMVQRDLRGLSLDELATEVGRFIAVSTPQEVSDSVAYDVAVSTDGQTGATVGFAPAEVSAVMAEFSNRFPGAIGLRAFQVTSPVDGAVHPVSAYAGDDGSFLLVRFADMTAAELFEASSLEVAEGHGDQVSLVVVPRNAQSLEEDFAIPQFGAVVEELDNGLVWRDVTEEEGGDGLHELSTMAPGLTAVFRLSPDRYEVFAEQLHSSDRARAQVNVWSYFLDFAAAVTFSTIIDVLILGALLLASRVLVGRLIAPLGELTRIFESWRQFRGGELGSGAALQAMDSSGLSALKDIHSLQQGFRALAQDVMYGERRLSTIAANYDELLRSLPLGVLAVDGASRVQFLNDALGEMTGQRQEALQRLKGQAAQMLAGGITVDEWQLVLDDASPKSLLLVVNHRLDERGQESGLWVIVTDLTEQKQTSAQLIQASKLATLGEMSTGMAHELNQPLNVISLATSNLRFTIKKGKATPDNTLSKLDRIDGAVHRAANIIDHMRAFGRLAGEGLTEINLGEVVGGACNLLGEQLKLANIALLNEVPDQGLAVKGNAIQLEQVIINLVNNAKDAIKETQSAGTITVDSEVGGGRVRLRVTDSGGGIPDHVLPHIFEPFFTTKPVGKGTGLGGSISYGIVREMQGDIWAENVSGGAQITISLPLVDVGVGAEPLNLA